MHDDLVTVEILYCKLPFCIYYFSFINYLDMENKHAFRGIHFKTYIYNVQIDCLVAILCKTVLMNTLCLCSSPVCCNVRTADFS